MVSFKTAFLVHAACSGLFCVPYAILGLDGMIGLFSEGAETGTKFGLHVTGESSPAAATPRNPPRPPLTNRSPLQPSTASRT